MADQNRTGRRIRSGRIGLAMGCLVLLGGCTVEHPLGVTTTDGAPTIIFPSCGEVVYYVSLTAGDADRSPVYWSIQSKSGSTLTEFVVGVAPPGFVEEVPLDASFTDAEELSAGVSSGPDSYDGDIVFTIADLRQDQVFDGDGYTTRDGLQRSAESSVACGGGVAGTGLNRWQVAIAAAVILGFFVFIGILSWRTVRSHAPLPSGGDEEAPTR